jgi:16S rRNA (guanine(1405)-N(7))-methyltransferase
LSDLDSVVEAVLTSPRYARVCEELVVHVASIELQKRPSFKEAVKATKSKLHQVAGSYLDIRMEYGDWLEELQRAGASGSAEAWEAACRDILRHQSSTRERLPIVERFYREVLEPVGAVHSVLDLGCGLNPLAARWMPLAEGAEYRAYDVYADMVDFVGAFLRLAGLRGGAVCDDVSRLTDVPPAQVVFMLKCVPVLDQLDRSAVPRILELVDGAHVLISFPLQSLGGKKKGMVRTYEARMAQLASGKPWMVRRFEYATELAFLVSTSMGR